MSFYKKCFNVTFYFATFWVFTVAAPSLDNFLSEYYWGSSELRTQDELNCDSDIVKLICYNKCKNENQFYKCQDNVCECFDLKEEDDRALSKTVDRPAPYYPFEDNKYLLNSNELVDGGLGIGVLRMPIAVQPKEDFSEHPALRHHIAHFCENLDLARKCIRSCMKLGKPAFCGKDHVCYCGHRYNSNDINKEIKLDDMYGQFRDLYEKYFGPQDGKGKNQNEDQDNGAETDWNDEENDEHLKKKF